MNKPIAFFVKLCYDQGSRETKIKIKDKRKIMRDKP